MNSSPHIAEVTGKDFVEKVLERSRTVPVLVDFWASWCAPCQMLMPVLARLADDYQGKFFLAKVNTDAEQELARRYGIRSLPTMRLFKDGEPVDGFIGVQPERTIRALIERYIVRESDVMATEARRLIAAGQADQALALLRRAAERDPGNDRVAVALAEALLAAERHDEAEQTIKALPPQRQLDADIAALKARLELARLANGAPPSAALEKRLAADPNDSEARYFLAIRHIAAGDHAAGLEQLLELVRRDRRFREDAARKAMIGVFNMLGGAHPLTNRYRGLLSSALN